MKRWFALLALLLSGVAQAGIVLQDDRGTTHHLAAPPQRIVSLLPSLTESVCALGACARLVAVDRFSNWPAEAARLPHLGGMEDPQIERIVALRPDVVLLARSSRATQRLEALGLKAIVFEAQTHADVRRVLNGLAALLGEPQRGAEAWQRIQAQIDAAARRVPPALHGRSVYFEVSSAPHAAGESSFIGETLTRLGLANAVPAALGPFPKLNPEFVVRAAPDIVMGPRKAIDGLAARPGWATLPALRSHRTCGFDSAPYDTLVRPGPRLGDAAELMADCLERLP